MERNTGQGRKELVFERDQGNHAGRRDKHMNWQQNMQVLMLPKHKSFHERKVRQTSAGRGGN